MADRPVEAPHIDPCFACFQLSIRASRIHRFGVYAGERIPANRKVIEYTGERINRREAKRRNNDDFTCLFAVDKYWTIDGSAGGSGAEIINHSCEPNLISRVMKGHILYMSLRVIPPGEELTIDYNFPANTSPSPCRCGAAKCRGTMQRKC
jgi:SET domain-containing protein